MEEEARAELQRVLAGERSKTVRKIEATHNREMFPAPDVFGFVGRNWENEKRALRRAIRKGVENGDLKRRVDEMLLPVVGRTGRRNTNVISREALHYLMRELLDTERAAEFFARRIIEEAQLDTELYEADAEMLPVDSVVKVEEVNFGKYIEDEDLKLNVVILEPGAAAGEVHYLFDEITEKMEIKKVDAAFNRINRMCKKILPPSPLKLGSRAESARIIDTHGLCQLVLASYKPLAKQIEYALLHRGIESVDDDILVDVGVRIDTAKKRAEAQPDIQQFTAVFEQMKEQVDASREQVEASREQIESIKGYYERKSQEIREITGSTPQPEVLSFRQWMLDKALTVASRAGVDIYEFWDRFWTDFEEEYSRSLSTIMQNDHFNGVYSEMDLPHAGTSYSWHYRLPSKEPEKPKVWYDRALVSVGRRRRYHRKNAIDLMKRRMVQVIACHGSGKCTERYFKSHG